MRDWPHPRDPEPVGRAWRVLQAEIAAAVLLTIAGWAGMIVALVR